MSNNYLINLITTNVYHFLNGHCGGVYHVVRNLILHSRNPAVKNHVIYVIEKERFPDWEHLSIAGGCEEYIFLYSRYENIYHVYKRLAQKIPQEAVLVAHDWFELGMVSGLGLTNRLIYVLHGNYDYYYSLFEKHKQDIDIVLCVTQASYARISAQNLNREHTFHFRFPVPTIPFVRKDFSVLRIAVIAENLTDPNKGLTFIRDINRELIQKAIQVEWHLAGNGFTNESLKSWWGDMKNLPVYYGYLSQDQIPHFFAGTNVYILPSLNEGVPVSLVEAMKAGLIPVITNWTANVNHLVIDGESGVVLKDASVISYANALLYISNPGFHSSLISENASRISNHQFDPFRQVDEFEEYVLQKNRISFRNKRKIYGSRLDNEIIPNIITVIFRKFKSLWAPHCFL